MRTIKTIAPYGLNVKNGIFNSATLSMGFCGSDIELEFWTRLWHYSDTNTGTCSF